MFRLFETVPFFHHNLDASPHYAAQGVTCKRNAAFYLHFVTIVPAVIDQLGHFVGYEQAEVEGVCIHLR
ncbi:hypothetical protein KQX54_019270 [Cotesia glomerata]|uniref:Uncharacterized protein n=1 Tax=Cotesia glomerata TaxID=32391 RepID=A0AAV7I0Z7_COTGL|nr:hypothetical protein KQX54_019270 [Cotesia glomerata]